MTARATLAAAVVGLAIAGGAAPAIAQSRRYPAPVIDPDDAGEHESGFWSTAADPGRARYEQQLRDALLVVRGDPARAIALLRDATATRPELVDGWGYLGLLTDQVRDFRSCAEAYRRALALDPRWTPSRDLAPGRGIGVALAGGRSLTIAHAVCRGRSGDVAGAIAALEAVVARGETMAELWLRLGEAHLAAGRLNDAAHALTEATSASGGRDHEAAWLLAVAHDRARRTSSAEAAARDAQRYDPGAASATGGNRPPPIAIGDREYLLGLAALTPPSREPPEPATPERALMYFRRYLEIAPADSPWRARADEHLQAVRGLDLAARVGITGGALDRAAVERAVRGKLPALRACVVALPSTLLELRITALGPAAGPARPATGTPAPLRRAPAGAARRPRVAPRVPVRPAPPSRHAGVIDPSRPPDGQQPGLSAYQVLSFRPPAEALDDAVTCVEKVGAGLTLPRPPAGSWATVRIPIAAP